MFKINIGGTPALSMLELKDIDRNTLYLASDQRSVVMQDDHEGGHLVFDLITNEIALYSYSDTSVITETYPGLAVVFPSGTVIISLSLEIMGGTK